MDGDILKRLIKESGMTQEEFARKAGTSRSTVILLTQRAVISDEWKKKVCGVLNVGMEVWSGKESATSYPINEDPSHVLTVAERDALWRIIETQKGIIARLEAELKNSKD